VGLKVKGIQIGLDHVRMRSITIARPIEWTPRH